MRSILLYHIYPINHWREITDLLFQKLPFDKIVVHVSLPADTAENRKELEGYFKKYGVKDILYSLNSGIGEVDALRSFVRTQDLQGFDILTYMHCKGVTKPGNKHILEWTKLMRYFIIEKMDRCKKAFRQGFVTFGINKSVPDKGDTGFLGCRYFYEGNFVSLNLNKVNLKEAVNKHLENAYYGVEGFWGKLGSYKDGYTMFNSGINHYLMSVAEKDYMTAFGRWRYNRIKSIYILKASLSNKKQQWKKRKSLQALLGLVRQKSLN